MDVPACLTDRGSGPTARFPFGKQALIPVVIAVPGMALLATLVYAAVKAVRVILAGGTDITAGSLAAYGSISTVVSVMIWRYVDRVDRTSDLPVTEARQGEHPPLSVSWSPPAQ